MTDCVTFNFFQAFADMRAKIEIEPYLEAELMVGDFFCLLSDFLILMLHFLHRGHCMIFVYVYNVYFRRLLLRWTKDWCWS